MTEPIATVKQGKIKGVTDTDLDGEKYYKFLGIPYAKPPVGSLRFKAPHLAESWSGIRDCTKEGNQCLSTEMLSKKIVGSEDCLFLNVFTKQLPKAGLSHKPVMVFIHGGAFTLGSASELVHGSKHLICEDIVLVTINYRLGIFGFLSSDDLSLEVPGNAGLKDQTFALKWVQENISNFNGDPNNVTIFGVSAGGASVHFQVLSPTAKGLFHKAIAQSGTVLNPWAWGQKNLKQVATVLKKDVSDEKDAFEVLMNTPAEELFQASRQVPDLFYDSAHRRPFGPVIEKPNPTAFLTENPTDLMASGKFNKVPFILGCTNNEGLIVEFKSDEIEFEVKERELGAFWSLGLKENSEKHINVKSLINEFYFKEGSTKKAIHKIIGDVFFNIGIMESAKLSSRTSNSPVYLYVFSYAEQNLVQLMRKVFCFGDGEGICHAGDQIFLFNNQVPDLPNPDPKEFEKTKSAIKQVTKIWADFARTGRPHERWEPLTNENELKYFEIHEDFSLKVKPFAERIEFWEKILKDIPGIDAKVYEHAEV